jgi:hypothetical protein
MNTELERNLESPWQDGSLGHDDISDAYETRTLQLGLAK